MDWLKSLLQSLPLDTISDMLGNIVVWWSHLVADVPPADLPMYAYVGGSVIVLLLWLLVARMLPKPLGGISWVILFAVLFAPGSALNEPGVIAPASISVVYAVMMKDIAGAITNALPILVVMAAGLFLGFIWQLLRGAIERGMAKSRLRAEQNAAANMQLAGADYINPSADIDAATEVNLVKEKKK